MAHRQSLPVDTELIGDFRILGLLGSGGFANTYLALDHTLGREVAIKEFFPSDLAIRGDTQSVSVRSAAQESQFQWAMGRFVREAKTLAKFRHPSVVRVFRVFNANDTAYIVLEFVRGANMGAWLKRLQRPPTQEELDELLPPLLDALEVVHSAGILHRDIKPANIYIREADQTPVLLDFGAAKYAASGGVDQVGTTAAIVSKGYSPNEAYATDSRLLGPWTDIYGLGATLYRALTGGAPPESTSRILHDECVPVAGIAELAGKYRPDFLAGIDWALAIIPKDRPQSIAQWRAEIVPEDLQSRPDPRENVPSDAEWRPLSEPQSDAANVYSKPGPPHPIDSGGSNVTAQRERSPPRGSAGDARTPSATPTKPAHLGEDRDSTPTAATGQARHWSSNPTFVAGILLFAVGALGLFSQWGGGGPDEVKSGTRSLAGDTHAVSAQKDAQLKAEEAARRAQEQLELKKEETARRQREEAERYQQALSAEKAGEAERMRKAEEARTSEAERAWDRVKDSRSIAVLDAFTQQFGGTFYATLARERLAELTQEAEESAARKATPLIKRGASFRDCPECPEMVVIPPGEFLMGTSTTETASLAKAYPDNFKDEWPQHKVTFEQSFAVGKTHITRGEFRAFVNASGYKVEGSCFAWTGDGWKEDPKKTWQSPGYPQDDRHPVVCVSWHDANAYADWLTKTTGSTYRLPTEAEAEYIARASTTATEQPRYFFGNEQKELCTYANGADKTAKAQSPGWIVAPCKDGYVFTAPSANFSPNPFGVYDVYGNVWTWTADCYAPDYNNAFSDGRPAPEIAGCDRALRGGSWIGRPEELGSAVRSKTQATNKVNIDGFRIARNL